MVKKMVLGRGLGSLIQENPAVIMQANTKALYEQEKEVQPKEIVNGSMLVDISQIKLNSKQPRKIFKEKDMEELVASIRENGVIQPLIVAKVEGGFKLIAGERRLRASMRAGLEKVPVVVKNATERDIMIMSIIENVQRSDLNCVEEALAYLQLMEDYKLTQEEVALKVGKERSTVANFLRIIRLPKSVIKFLQEEVLSFGHAKVLASLKESEQIIRLANLTVAKQLSVRELEQLAKKDMSGLVREKKSNPFFDEKLDDLRQRLEQQTGYHFTLQSKKNGAGKIVINFNNEAEFNDIFEFLMKK